MPRICEVLFIQSGDDLPPENDMIRLLHRKQGTIVRTILLHIRKVKGRRTVAIIGVTLAGRDDGAALSSHQGREYTRAYHQPCLRMEGYILCPVRLRSPCILSLVHHVFFLRLIILTVVVLALNVRLLSKDLPLPLGSPSAHVVVA